MSQTPLILALETTSDVCGVALLRGEKLIVEQTFGHEMRLSERLLDIVVSLLHFAEVSLSEIDAFGVGVGPGSFTGVRVGVMTAKVFACVQGKPIYGVQSLEALASEYLGIQNIVVAPLLPCRANSVYLRPFALSPILRPLSETQTLSIEESILVLKALNTPLILCGAGATRYKENIEALWGEGEPLSFALPSFPRAETIGRLTAQRIQQGDIGENVLELVPEYVAPPPISQPKQAYKILNHKEKLRA
jgi:tRNA threonylcarbamoyladenosine biosynthesis protein TsaB